MKILTIPDKSLRAKAEKTIKESEYTQIELKELLIDSAEKSDEQAVGLAAPQVGLPIRAFIVLIDGEWKLFDDPEISQIGPQGLAVEGCLSIPGKRFFVERPEAFTVDDKVQGKLQVSGTLARRISHEYDHLNGVLVDERGDPIQVPD